MAKKVELSELIQHVADELRAVNAPPDSDVAPVMQFTEAEIEMGISIEKKAEGGLKVWVLELGGGRTKADTTTINVKFSAIPGHGVVALCGRPGHQTTFPTRRTSAKPAR